MAEVCEVLMWLAVIKTTVTETKQPGTEDFGFWGEDIHGWKEVRVLAMALSVGRLFRLMIVQLLYRPCR